MPLLSYLVLVPASAGYTQLDRPPSCATPLQQIVFLICTAQAISSVGNARSTKGETRRTNQLAIKTVANLRFSHSHGDETRATDPEFQHAYMGLCARN